MDTQIDVRSFIEIEFDGAPFRITDNDLAITPTWSDNEYQASQAIAPTAGHILALKDRSQNTLTIELAVADPDVVTKFQNAAQGHIKTSVVFGTADEIYERIAAEIDIVSFRFNAQSKSMILTISLKDFLTDDRGITRQSAVFNEATQHARDATDTSTRFLVYLQRQAILGKWGPVPVQPRVKKPNLFQQAFIVAASAVIGYYTGGTLGHAAFAAAGTAYQQQQQNKVLKRLNEQVGTIDTRVELVSNSPEPVRRFIFGECLVGGDQLYIGVHNEYLSMIIMVADHSIEEVREIWVGNGRYSWQSNPSPVDIPDGETDYAAQVITTDRLDGASLMTYPERQGYNRTIHYRRTVGHGQHRSQEPATRIEFVETAPGWNNGGFDWDTAADKATGTAIVGVQLIFDAEKYLPWQNLRFLVRGNNNIYDPRIESGDQTIYSDNPALVMGAYLNQVAGLPYLNADNTLNFAGTLTADEVAVVNAGIDTQSIIDAANTCDAEGWTCAGTADLDEPINRVLDALAQTMAGYWFFDGERVQVLAGIAHAPNARAIVNDDIINMGGEFQKRARERYNSVGGSYRNDPDNGRYEDTGYPEWVDAAALAADNNYPNRATVDFPYVSDAGQCLHLASIGMARNRAGGLISIDVSADIGKNYNIGERITLNLTEPAALAGIFRITRIDRNWDAMVYQIQAHPDPDSAYADQQVRIDDIVANIVQSNPISSIAPRLGEPQNIEIGLDYSDGGGIVRDGTLFLSVVVRFTGGQSDWLVQVQKRSDEDWVGVAHAESISNEYGDGIVWLGSQAAGAEIDLRLRFIDKNGFTSPWVIVDTYTVPLDGTRPDAPTAISVVFLTVDSVRLRIQGVQSRDLAYFEARYTIDHNDQTPNFITNENEWDAATEMAGAAASAGADWLGDFALDLSGRYRVYVRAVDRTGNISELNGVNVVFPFNNNAGQIANQTFSDSEGWAGCALAGLLEVATGELVPLSRQTGAQTNGLSRAAQLAYWNNEGGWLFNDAAVDSNSRITLPILDLGLNVDGGGKGGL